MTTEALTTDLMIRPVSMQSTEALIAEAGRLEEAHAGDEWPRIDQIRYSFIKEELRNR